MRINTKYNIGDKFWALDKNKARELEVYRIQIDTYKRGKMIQRGQKPRVFSIKYQANLIEFYEYQMFNSKEELIKSL